MKGEIAVAEPLLEALTVALGRAARYNRSAMVAPAAVLWPDETRQWAPILPLLRELLPALLTLGEYAPEERCLLAGEPWPRCARAFRPSRSTPGTF